MAPAIIIIIIIKTINLLTSIPSFLFSFAFCFVPFRFHWFYIRIENRSERMKYTRYIYIYTWDDRREKKVATAHPRQPVLRSLYDPLAFQFKAHRLTITSFPPRSVVLRRMGGTHKKKIRGADTIVELEQMDRRSTKSRTKKAKSVQCITWG